MELELNAARWQSILPDTPSMSTIPIPPGLYAYVRTHSSVELVAKLESLIRDGAEPADLELRIVKIELISRLKLKE